VTLPLYRGTSRGKTVWYVVLDSSEGKDADAKGANTAQKLQNARGTTAVERVRIVNGVVDFPASVDFSPAHLVEPPDGTIENAPQIARDANGDGIIEALTEAADKIVSLDLANRRVVYRET